MEIQLKELIDQIKKDGVETAELQASAKLEEANAQAEQIIARAQAQADQILRDAKEENDRLVRSAEDAIRQAGRNMLISFRAGVAKELDAVVGKEISALYSSEQMPALMAQVIVALAENREDDAFTVLVNSREMEALEGALLTALKGRVQQGVTVKAGDNFSGGFRIGVNNGRAYYDFSAESVTEMLAAYLNPRITALLKEAEGV